MDNCWRCKTSLTAKEADMGNPWQVWGEPVCKMCSGDLTILEMAGAGISHINADMAYLLSAGTKDTQIRVPILVQVSA